MAAVAPTGRIYPNVGGGKAVKFSETLFQSYFLSGFECSSHRRADGKRVDKIAASGHDVFAAGDYRARARAGLRSVRDGLQ